MTTLLADPVAQVVATAEELLTRRAGATVRLAEPEDLGGSGPAIVLRVRAVQNPFALPKTMVIKQVPQDGSAEAVLREVVSYQFANSLTAQHRPGPELVAYDLAERLIVLTDLGTAPTMSRLMVESGPGIVDHALMAWGQALGRMHVATLGREGDFAALLRRIDVKRVDVKAARQRHDARDIIAPLAEILRTDFGVNVPKALAKRVQQTTALFVKGGVRAFSPSEVAPDNILVTEHGVRILDYEWGGFRDVVLDIAHALTVYPEFLNPADRSAHAELDDAMIEAWRSEIASVAPAFVDDTAMSRQIIDARLMWVWLATHEHLALDAFDVAAGQAAPTRTCLLARWAGLQEAAARAGEDAIAAHADAVIVALQRMS